MALIAAGHLSGWRDLVRVRQRKTGVGMVERRIRPHNGVVALRAKRRREACRDVVRHCPAKCRRAVPRRLVTTVAIRVRRRKRVVVSDVAIRAGIGLARRRHLVRTRQWPARRAVIKYRRRPGNRIVARRTIRGRKRRSRT